MGFLVYLLFKKCLFQHQTQCMINRKMQFLNLKGLRLRHNDRHIGTFS